MGLTLLGTLRDSGWTMCCYTSRVEHLHQQQRRQLQLHPPLRAGLLPHQGRVRVRRLVRKESWLESTYGVVHGRDCDLAGARWSSRRRECRAPQKHGIGSSAERDGGGGRVLGLKASAHDRLSRRLQDVLLRNKRALKARLIPAMNASSALASYTHGFPKALPQAWVKRYAFCRQNT